VAQATAAQLRLASGAPAGSARGAGGAGPSPAATDVIDKAVRRSQSAQELLDEIDTSDTRLLTIGRLADVIGRLGGFVRAAEVHRSALPRAERAAAPTVDAWGRLDSTEGRLVALREGAVDVMEYGRADLAAENRYAELCEAVTRALSSRGTAMGDATSLTDAVGPGSASRWFDGEHGGAGGGPGAGGAASLGQLVALLSSLSPSAQGAHVPALAAVCGALEARAPGMSLRELAAVSIAAEGAQAVSPSLVSALGRRLGAVVPADADPSTARAAMGRGASGTAVATVLGAVARLARLGGLMAAGAARRGAGAAAGPVMLGPGAAAGRTDRAAAEAASAGAAAEAGREVSAAAAGATPPLLALARAARALADPSQVASELGVMVPFARELGARAAAAGPGPGADTHLARLAELAATEGAAFSAAARGALQRGDDPASLGSAGAGWLANASQFLDVIAAAAAATAGHGGAASPHAALAVESLAEPAEAAVALVRAGIPAAVADAEAGSALRSSPSSAARRRWGGARPSEAVVSSLAGVEAFLASLGSACGAAGDVGAGSASAAVRLSACESALLRALARLPVFAGLSDAQAVLVAGTLAGRCRAAEGRGGAGSPVWGGDAGAAAAGAEAMADAWDTVGRDTERRLRRGAGRMARGRGGAGAAHHAVGVLVEARSAVAALGREAAAAGEEAEAAAAAGTEGEAEAAASLAAAAARAAAGAASCVDVVSSAVAGFCQAAGPEGAHRVASELLLSPRVASADVIGSAGVPTALLGSVGDVLWRSVDMSADPAATARLAAAASRALPAGDDTALMLVSRAADLLVTPWGEVREFQRRERALAEAQAAEGGGGADEADEHGDVLGAVSPVLLRSAGAESGGAGHGLPCAGLVPLRVVAALAGEAARRGVPHNALFAELGRLAHVRLAPVGRGDEGAADAAREQLCAAAGGWIPGWEAAGGGAAAESDAGAGLAVLVRAAVAAAGAGPAEGAAAALRGALADAAAAAVWAARDDDATWTALPQAAAALSEAAASPALDAPTARLCSRAAVDVLEALLGRAAPRDGIAVLPFASAAELGQSLAVSAELAATSASGPSPSWAAAEAASLLAARLSGAVLLAPARGPAGEAAATTATTTAASAGAGVCDLLVCADGSTLADVGVASLTRVLAAAASAGRSVGAVPGPSRPQDRAVRGLAVAAAEAMRCAAALSEAAAAEAEAAAAAAGPSRRVPSAPLSAGVSVARQAAECMLALAPHSRAASTLPPLADVVTGETAPTDQLTLVRDRRAAAGGAVAAPAVSRAADPAARLTTALASQLRAHAAAGASRAAVSRGAGADGVLGERAAWEAAGAPALLEAVAALDALLLARVRRDQGRAAMAAARSEADLARAVAVSPPAPTSVPAGMLVGSVGEALGAALRAVTAAMEPRTSARAVARPRQRHEVEEAKAEAEAAREGAARRGAAALAASRRVLGAGGAAAAGPVTATSPSKRRRRGGGVPGATLPSAVPAGRTRPPRSPSGAAPSRGFASAVSGGPAAREEEEDEEDDDDAPSLRLPLPSDAASLLRALALPSVAALDDVIPGARRRALLTAGTALAGLVGAVERCGAQAPESTPDGDVVPAEHRRHALAMGAAAGMQAASEEGWAEAADALLGAVESTRPAGEGGAAGAAVRRGEAAGSRGEEEEEEEEWADAWRGVVWLSQQAAALGTLEAAGHLRPAVGVAVRRAVASLGPDTEPGRWLRGFAGSAGVGLGPQRGRGGADPAWLRGGLGAVPLPAMRSVASSSRAERPALAAVLDGACLTRVAAFARGEEAAWPAHAVEAAVAFASDAEGAEGGLGGRRGGGLLVAACRAAASQLDGASDADVVGVFCAAAAGAAGSVGGLGPAAAAIAGSDAAAARDAVVGPADGAGEDGEGAGAPVGRLVAGLAVSRALVQLAGAAADEVSARWGAMGFDDVAASTHAAAGTLVLGAETAAAALRLASAQEDFMAGAEERRAAAEADAAEAAAGPGGRGRGRRRRRPVSSPSAAAPGAVVPSSWGGVAEAMDVDAALELARDAVSLAESSITAIRRLGEATAGRASSTSTSAVQPLGRAAASLMTRRDDGASSAPAVALSLATALAAQRQAAAALAGGLQRREGAAAAHLLRRVVAELGDADAACETAFVVAERQALDAVTRRLCRPDQVGLAVRSCFAALELGVTTPATPALMAELVARCEEMRDAAAAGKVPPGSARALAEAIGGAAAAASDVAASLRPDGSDPVASAAAALAGPLAAACTEATAALARRAA